jgi:hypothetical protein
VGGIGVTVIICALFVNINFSLDGKSFVMLSVATMKYIWKAKTVGPYSSSEVNVITDSTDIVAAAQKAGKAAGEEYRITELTFLTEAWD